MRHSFPPARGLEAFPTSKHQGWPLSHSPGKREWRHRYLCKWKVDFALSPAWEADDHSGYHLSLLVLHLLGSVGARSSCPVPLAVDVHHISQLLLSPWNHPCMVKPSIPCCLWWWNPDGCLEKTQESLSHSLQDVDTSWRSTLCSYFHCPKQRIGFWSVFWLWRHLSQWGWEAWKVLKSDEGSW